MEALPYRQHPHWLARPTRPPDHETLLTLARKVRAAAADEDPSRMERAAIRFNDELDRHLRAEALAMGQIAPPEARILKQGQDRIHKLASGLMSDAGHGCAGSHHNCESHAEELLALLSLQARDEHHAWRSQAA